MENDIEILNPARRYILIETPKIGSKYGFLMILKSNIRIHIKRSVLSIYKKSLKIALELKIKAKWSHDEGATLKKFGSNQWTG